MIVSQAYLMTISLMTFLGLDLLSTPLFINTPNQRTAGSASSWRSGPDQGLDDVRCLTSLASDPSLPKVPTKLDQLTPAYYETFLRLTVLFLILIRTASAEER